jgi:endonuclease/exonuclease/phosphatase family metal-dependent hydrolase
MKQKRDREPNEPNNKIRRTKTKRGLQIATLNTYRSSVVTTANSLEPLRRHSVDIVMLQELWDIPEQRARRLLAQQSFRLVAHNQESGLAIALSEPMTTRVVAVRNISHDLFSRPVGLQKFVEHLLQPYAEPHLTRGVLCCTIDITAPSQIALRLCTSHPTIAVRPLSRNRQLNELRAIIAKEPTNNTIIGGDMNHHPRPRMRDRRIAEKLGLQIINNCEPTFIVEQKLHKFASGVYSLLSSGSLRSQHPILDTLLHGNDFRCTGINTIDVPPSDHRAVIATFELNN